MPRVPDPGGEVSPGDGPQSQSSQNSVVMENICHKCCEPITTTQFLRVGKFRFHKDHFTCTVCDKSLQKEDFRTKDNQFYCAKDFIDLFCPVCRHCNEKITSGKAYQAFGGFYHPHHFVCKTCEKPFSENGKYFEVNNHPYCEEHKSPPPVSTSANQTCAECNKTIATDASENDMVRIGGQWFHQTCLVCFHCNTPLGENGTVFRKEDKIYCRDDYFSFFCRRCTACSEYIFKYCVSVNDEFYHPTCLKCAFCQRELDKYICVGGYLRCIDHQEEEMPTLTCDDCEKPINDNKIIRNQGKTLHRECFRCHKCSKELEKQTARALKKQGKLSQEDHLYCPDCAESEQPPRRKPTARMTKYGVETKRIDVEIEWQRGEKIGQGAFGKVFMAINSRTGELLAVKQISVKQHNHEQLKEIQKEIRVMENLTHSNIVHSLGTQWKGDKLCILMEYVPGKSLDVLLQQFGAFSEDVLQSYACQLVEALSYCHANHVVHRDIKGKNILVDTQGTLKLADFGSAKEFQNVLSKDAPSISYSYTPLWTAPEVLSGDYNSKVDIWGLGCVLIEMASGEQPWCEEKFENPYRALYHIGNSNAIPRIPDTLTKEATAFIVLCLTRDPDNRPSAAELLRHPWIKAAKKRVDAGRRKHNER